MPTLIDLPAELLEEILSLLSISDYSKLSRTCKALHGFVSPRIYHTIDWSWDDDKQCLPYDLLLRALLSHAELASYIKVIRLRGGGIIKRESWRHGSYSEDWSDWYPLKRARSIWDDQHRSTLSFGSTTMQKIHAVISCIAPSYTHERDWIQEFERGNIDVMVSLILYLSQNITQLDLGFGYVQHSQYTPQVFRYLMNHAKTNPPFPHLVSVNIGLDDPYTPRGIWSDIDVFRLFMYLPNLAYFNTILLEPPVFAWPSPTMMPRSEALSSLILRKCTASEGTLGKILSCTPQLKHLVYDYYRMVACDGPHWECSKEWYWTEPFRPKVLIHGPRLSKALAHVQQTLESLVLKVRFESKYGDNIQDAGDTPYLCGLVGRVIGLDEMPKLASLEVSWVLLLGWEPDFGGDRASRRDFSFDLHELSTINSHVATHFPWPAILPPAIKTLRLRDDLSDFSHYPKKTLDPVVFLKHLLYSRTNNFTVLQHVDFVFIWSQWYEYEGWPKPPMEKLLRICQRDGIECEIFREEPNWKLPESVE